MAKVTIYHNPRCSKSRQTLAILNDEGESVDVVEYLNEPPSASKLDSILKSLDLQPLDVIRAGEKRFKELGLSKKDDRPRKEWIKLMVENPILIERPIVVKNKKAALGRPPENVLDIL
ncbi:MAG: arsenate reductase (glutaredoxin) [Candidatus Eisenbacteria bacterium]|uniref:Arsenate reductase (Glutaredoxin) n=1 Tax=Eiseniibacteriota bacterium TaxID=2212470 RepID=A0A7Y2H0X8_UNCEI|nr:arsenate reductase (glutaredoxin) [Candidatus Eisenbacteria bacterium]